MIDKMKTHLRHDRPERMTQEFGLTIRVCDYEIGNLGEIYAGKTSSFD